MPWRRVSKSELRAPLTPYEWNFWKFFGNSQFVIGQLLTLRFQDSISTDRIENHLKQSWLQLRFEFPSLATTLDGEEKVYEVPDKDVLRQWLGDSFRTSTRSPDVNDGALNLSPSRDLPSLTYFSGTCQILFRFSHWRSDCIGVAMMIDRFLHLLAEPDHETPNWGQETLKLQRPGWYEALGFPDDPEQNSDDVKALYGKMIADMIPCLPSVGLPYSGDTTTSPSKTGHVRVTLSQAATSALVARCKKSGYTISSSIHTAMVRATYQLCDEDSKSLGMLTFVARDWRRHSPSPLGTSEYACEPAMSATFHALPKGAAEWTFEDVASRMASFYRNDFQPDAHIKALGQAVHANRAIFTAPTPPDWPENSYPWLSSLGCIEEYIKTNYITKGDASLHFQVEDFSAQILAQTREPIVYALTFQDQLRLEVSYNEAYHSVNGMQDFLKLVLMELDGLAGEPLQVISRD